MTSFDHRSDPNTGKDWLAYAPPAWLAVVLLLSLRGLVMSWPVLSYPDLPASIQGFVYASMAVGVVTLLWGVFVLGLAVAKSHRFPRAFVAWQIAVLVFLVTRELYVLATPAFVFSLGSHIWPAVEAVIGVCCLVIALRDKSPVAVHTVAMNAPAMRPPAGALTVIVAALLGIVVGAVVGFGVGVLAGSVIAEATDISCFEGGCGYFAVFIGLLGLLVGSIAGGILAVWLVRRRKPAAT